MCQTNCTEPTEWFSAFSDGRLEKVRFPLSDVIQAIWESGQIQQAATSAAPAIGVPSGSTAKQEW
jgi:hypothetical protein